MQQKMEGPIRTQSMFESNEEKEFINPSLANDDEEDNRLGGILRKSTLIKSNFNSNNIPGMNMNNKFLPGMKN